MLDIRFIRENPDLVRTSSRNKGYEVNIDRLLELDLQLRSKRQQADEIREKRNQLNESIKGQKPSEDVMSQGRDLKEELSVLDEELRVLDEEFNRLINQIPNITKSDVPLGGEADSVEIRSWGDKKTAAVDHLDFATKKDWLDFERGAKVAGAKFYYLKGDLALLENAITQFALEKLISKKFTYMNVPHLINQRTAVGAGFSPKNDDAGNEYAIEGEDLILIGTAEGPLTGYHADEIIDEKDLPLNYVGLSPCYRKEAGTYGKHNRGLFRVHQFNKLEMYIFTTPENSEAAHEEILSIEEDIWQSLGVPYRVVNVAAGDLGSPASKKYDIEYWSPVDQAYRELTSASNCTDFQARNLNIRVRRADGDIEMVHTLNGTAVSLARSLVAILENYQTEDGKLMVPAVLQPYLGGRELL